MTNRVAIITDTHWGARSDNLTYLDYFEQFYTEVFWPKIDELGIDTILHLGDIVDRRKFINYITLERMNEVFFDNIRKRGIDFHLVVGNHDIPYRHSNDLNAISVLRDVDNISLYDKPTTVAIKGNPILFIPWVNRENEEATLAEIERTGAKIAMGHLQIQGADMGGGQIARHGTSASTFAKFDIVLSGHFHKRTVYENIHYIGNPYHMYWDDFGTDRGFTIMDLDTQEMELIQNPHSIFNKIYYNDVGRSFKEVMDFNFAYCTNSYCKLIVEQRENPYWFDQFVSKIDKSSPANLQIIDVEILQENFTDEDVAEEVENTLTTIEKYVTNNVSDKIDKDKLTYLLQVLYREAETLEGA